MLSRLRKLGARAALAGALALSASTAALAQGTLRIGMTASDIPLTTGQTDNGGEGMRFMGYTVYDGLINWDLSSAELASDLVPGLATSVASLPSTPWIAWPSAPTTDAPSGVRVGSTTMRSRRP